MLSMLLIPRSVSYSEQPAIFEPLVEHVQNKPEKYVPPDVTGMCEALRRLHSVCHSQRRKFPHRCSHIVSGRQLASFEVQRCFERTESHPHLFSTILNGVFVKI